MDASVTYSLEECIDYIGFGKFQWRLITVLGFGVTADAAEIMLLAILGPALTCYWPNVTEIRIALLTMSVVAGAMCGAFVFGIIADKYGRRRVIVTTAILNTLFGIFTAFAPSYYWILLARTLNGFALAGAVQCETLMLEYLPSSTRANIIIIFGLFGSLGGIFECLLGMVIIPTYGWRWLAILSALPISIVAACMYFVPESPRYYMASGQQKGAERVLEIIALTNKRSLPPGKLLDVNARDECGSIKQLFHINFRRTSFLLTFMWMTIGMSYYGLILINTSLMTLLNDDKPLTTQTSTIQPTQCKMLTTDNYLSLIFTTFGEIFGIPLLLFLLSRFDRRTTCLINFSSASICFALFLIIPRHEPWIFNIITFIARMFTYSQFSLLYLYTMEVYPTVIRCIAVGCGSSMARVGTMISPYLAQVLIKQSFYGTIGVYVLATAIAAFFSFLLPIETRGRELKQATFDLNVPSTTSNNTVELSSMSTVDDMTSLVHGNNGIVNNGYESIKEDDANGEKTQ